MAPLVSSPGCRAVRLGDLTSRVVADGAGGFRLEAVEALGPYPARLTERLVATAAAAPARPLLTWRSGGGREALSYGDALRAIGGIGEALLRRSLSAERPIVILSGNDRWHAVLALAALQVGIPYVPVSPAYSLVSRDFGTLRQVMNLVTPGLVFAADDRFAPAIAATAGDAEVIDARVLDEWAASAPTARVDAAHAAIPGDRVAKILFTSGSVGVPKAVINTHAMLCSNQQMILQALPFLGDEPPVLVDWLPWHHTFGGNHNLGLVIYNGGTLHIDEGRPLPGAFEESVRTLREVLPTVYMNVPRGFEELVRALRDDPDLATRFFGHVRCLFYAAAALPQPLAEALQELAVRSCGERLMLLTGLGATETAPMAMARSWDSPVAAAIGLPVPGLTIKLTPLHDDRYEVWARGPNITPGYWRQPELTRAAFDAEGFYRMGDAVRLEQPGDPSRGLIFDGRVAEDFKMSSGTWVRVGPLRARIVRHFAPLVRDAVITGHDRSALGMLAVPDLDACRRHAGLPAESPSAAIVAHPRVREALAEQLRAFNDAATGSTSRITRMLLLDTPLSLDRGEVTDKGSLNQRAILRSRAALVESLYSEPVPAEVIAHG
ncbi:MAG: feruloyl-CoA synthase [Vicinamibacterales bacterium]